MEIDTVLNIGSIRFSNLTFSFLLSEKHWATAPKLQPPPMRVGLIRLYEGRANSPID